MKITDIQTYVLKSNLGENRFLSSQRPFGSRNSLLVKITTDEDIYGWGEAGQYGPPEPVESFIVNVIKPLIIGKDPMEYEVIWEYLYNYTRDFGRKATPIEAISGIDIALWDIIGKAIGKPVYSLLGGAFRNKVVPYATGIYYRGQEYLNLKSSLLDAEREAKQFMDKGFKAIKMKVGLLTPTEDLERVRVVRETVGDNIKIMVDANHAYNVTNAIKLGRGLEKYDVYWFEEPVVPEDIEGYIEVRKALDMAIAGGECEYTRHGFKQLIASRAVDIVQPDICCAGGITELKKIGALASVWGIQIIPHIWGSGIALAAGLQVLASLPPYPQIAHPRSLINEPVLEFDQNPNPLRDNLLVEPIMRCQGHIKIPNKPGLGVEVDERVLRKYLIK